MSESRVQSKHSLVMMLMLIAYASIQMDRLLLQLQKIRQHVSSTFAQISNYASLSRPINPVPLHLVVRTTLDVNGII